MSKKQSFLWIRGIYVHLLRAKSQQDGDARLFLANSFPSVVLFFFLPFLLNENNLTPRLFMPLAMYIPQFPNQPTDKGTPNCTPT